MSKFKKSRYKAYTRLLDDVRNDFKLEKFNILKWDRIKKKIRFQINKWDIAFFKIKKWDEFKKKFKFKKQICYYKKLKFFYNHSGLSHKKNIFSSIFSFWRHKRFKKRFKNNLINKQKLIHYYNIRNYKLKKLIKVAEKFKGRVASKKYNFIQFLERRLDVILYKSGLVKTLYQSRQLINHKKVLINKVVQSKIDYLLNIGDFIEFTNLPKNYIKNNLKNIKKIKRRKKIFKFYKKKKKILFIKNKIFLKEFNQFNLSQKNCFKKIIKKKIKKKKKIKNINFFFLHFFPSHLEINYKTLSMIYIGNVNIKKLFSFYLNLPSIFDYYLFR